MFEKRKANNGAPDADDPLGTALRLLPNPEVSREFNSNIHAALADTGKSRPIWPLAGQLLGSVCGSFAVTLALLALSAASQRSAGDIKGPPINSTAAIYHNAGRMKQVDSLIERADLSSASVRYRDSLSPGSAIPVERREVGPEYH